jgi:hypothetical protein
MTIPFSETNRSTVLSLSLKSVFPDKINIGGEGGCVEQKLRQVC